MRAKTKEKRQMRQLELLMSGKKGGGDQMQLSPNDALVQVALPLVLILAIIARLMVFEIRTEDPNYLDPWKQQLILRSEKVLSKWEKESKLGAFPEFSRVQWGETTPEDELFQTLCQRGKELEQIDKVKKKLYGQVINYEPDKEGVSKEEAILFKDIYDPEYSKKEVEGIGEQFIINEEKRNYAMQYIEERCLNWRTIIEGHQWEMLKKVLEGTTLTDVESGSDRISKLMEKIAGQLEAKGYPLLATIKDKYGKSNE